MQKDKIAISINQDLLQIIDAKMELQQFRSRSHVIDHFLRKGLSDELIDTAVIMLTADQHKYMFSRVNKKLFLQRQLDFLQANGISTVVYTTQKSPLLEKIVDITKKAKFKVRTIINRGNNNALALIDAKEEFVGPLVVLSGDVLNNVDLRAMVRKHVQLDRLATIGIMSKQKTTLTEGSVLVDGDYVISFVEKSSKHISNIVNSGIYIIEPEALHLLEGKQNIEYELFPTLAELKQLVGHFIYGEYIHVGRKL